MTDLDRMTVADKLSNVPGWIGAVLGNALAQAAAANGGEVPEDALIRAMRLAQAFGAVPHNLIDQEADDE